MVNSSSERNRHLTDDLHDYSCKSVLSEKRRKMSHLNRDSSAEFPVDIKHVLHVWKLLHGSKFSSRTFSLQTLTGRRKAVATFINRSESRVTAWTTNRTLEGPEEQPEGSSPSVEVSVEENIIQPVVSANTSPGRKSLVTPEEYDVVRDVIHEMYKSKAYVTLKTLLSPVQEKLNSKLGKPTLYRVFPLIIIFFATWNKSSTGLSVTF